MVAVDLPAGDGDAGLQEYADVVVEAIDDRGELIVVAQSMGEELAERLETYRRGRSA
ncbi:hypothetical protein [Actinomadura macra]|uniref:hypothetical protein n=1 Tax=Actinomadura macra TaxID=46164 RepID=UPI00157D8F80|nr:hypothetical protein [Actinomadura macra]